MIDNVLSHKYFNYKLNIKLDVLLRLKDDIEKHKDIEDTLDIEIDLSINQTPFFITRLKEFYMRHNATYYDVDRNKTPIEVISELCNKYFYIYHILLL